MDGSTRDVLFKKVGLRRGTTAAPLAGRRRAILDVVPRLPPQRVFDEDSRAPDPSFREALLTHLLPNTLLLFDLGFLHFTCFDRLCEKQAGFLTRAKSNRVCRQAKRLRATRRLQESLVRAGSGAAACSHLLRLIEAGHQGQWYRCLTRVTDPGVLPAAAAAH